MSAGRLECRDLRGPRDHPVMRASLGHLAHPARPVGAGLQALPASKDGLVIEDNADQ